MDILNLIKNELRDKLTADIPELKLVRRFNNDIQRYVSGESSLFQPPACFIELVSPRTFSGTGGYQNDYSNEMQIRIHFVTMQKDESNDFDRLYELRSKVYTALAFHAKDFDNNIGGFNELQRTSEGEDLSFKGLGAGFIEFQCLFSDGTASRDKGEISVSGITTVINVEKV